MDLPIESAEAHSRRAAYSRAYRERHPERAKASADKYREKNRAACRERTLRWAASNRVSYKRSKFASRLRQYGITAEDWARAFDRQGGRCPSCSDALREGWHTVVDHCHRTGKFRGLLCAVCNRALGMLRDEPEIMRRLAAYAEGHQ